MATYSISAVFNKAANDITKMVLQMSNDMNIPMTVMPFILDKVMLDIQNEQLVELSDVTISLTNELEYAKSKIPPEPEKKKEGKKEDK